MTILGLPLIDVIVIIAYFVVVLWIGFRAMKRIKNPEDYFLAGRRFGKVDPDLRRLRPGHQRRSPR